MAQRIERMKGLGYLAFLALLIFYSTSVSGQTVSEEAKRHFDRGMAALEMVTKADD
jgi:hypothetical protein